jgi:hypothetical protein
MTRSEGSDVQLTSRIYHFAVAERRSTILSRSNREPKRVYRLPATSDWALYSVDPSRALTRAEFRRKRLNRCEIEALPEV